MTTVSPSTFAYHAQTPDGLRMSGTVDAADVHEAGRRLGELGLRVLEIGPSPHAPRPRPLRASDFAAFNQQLAHLAKAGLPLEHGLRLIAADLRNGRLSRTVELVAAELERGTPLGEAFEKHRAQFPPLYGRLVEAGVRAGNLPGVLFNLGRHLEVVQLLREALWRALAYPLMVTMGMALIVVFLGLFVLPQFELIFGEFKVRLPWATRWLLKLSKVSVPLAVALAAGIVGTPLLWGIVRAAGWGGRLTDLAARRMPLVGPVLRRNLVARWCNALRIGVAAGMDFPAAIAIAGDATGSPALRRDGQQLIATLEAGRPLTAAGTLRLLPPTIPATLHFAGGHHDLATTIDALGEMYQRQAELRLAAIPAILTPLMVLAIALMIGFVVFALVAPLVMLFNSMTGV